MGPPTWGGSQGKSIPSHPKKKVLIHHEWYPDSSGSHQNKTDPDASGFEFLDSVQFSPKVNKLGHYRITSHHKCEHHSHSHSHSPQCCSHQQPETHRCSSLHPHVDTPIPRSWSPISPLHSAMSGCKDPAPPPSSQPHCPLPATNVVHHNSLEVDISPHHGPSTSFVISPFAPSNDEDENTPLTAHD